jgi:hypothetical protein
MHTTFTEITQSMQPGVVSIVVRGFEEDLAAAARTAAPARPIDSAIVLYLARTTGLTDGRGQRVPVSPSGIRRTGDVIWISFRSAGPVDLAGTRFLNAALTERFDDQVNLVRIQTAHRNRTILFTPGDEPKAIGE